MALTAPAQLAHPRTARKATKTALPSQGAGCSVSRCGFRTAGLCVLNLGPKGALNYFPSSLRARLEEELCREGPANPERGLRCAEQLLATIDEEGSRRALSTTFGFLSSLKTVLRACSPVFLVRSVRQDASMFGLLRGPATEDRN